MGTPYQVISGQFAGNTWALAATYAGRSVLEALTLLEYARPSGVNSDPPAILMPLAPLPFDWLSVFNAQPGATLLLSPDWVIVGASDDYLAATLTERASLVGQPIFDAFPDNPATPEANAVANVRASLETVLATKQPHEMAPQHYDVPDPARPGQFVERHW